MPMNESVRFAISAKVWKCLRCSWVILVCCVANPSASQADERLPVLDTGAQVFSNVTVTSRSATHVFLKHSRGFASLRIADLSHDALVKLGYAQPEATNAVAPPVSTFKMENPLSKFDWNSRFEQAPKFIVKDGKVTLEAGGQSIEVDEHFVKGVLWSALFLYVLFCYCATLLCRKAGLRGVLYWILCWIPVLQLIPLLKAAGMSGWLILPWMIPPIGAILYIVWSIKICRARGRGAFAMIFLLLPATSPLAFLYLALASDGGEEEPHSGKVHLSFGASNS